MEQESNIEIPKRKIYRDRAIGVGTMLGGPLAATYFIAENFKAFNQKDKAKKTWLFGILATIIIFGGVFLIPENVNIPNQIIPLIYTAIAYFLVQHFQGKNITTHINAGGKFFGWWRAIGIGFIGLAIIIIPIFGYVYLSSPLAFNSTIKTFGKLNHEIVFRKNNITDNEVDKIAQSLTTVNFFDEVQQKTVFVKNEDNKYFIVIPVIDNAWNDTNATAYFVQLRNELQLLLPDRKIVIDMSTDLENTKKRIE